MRVQTSSACRSNDRGQATVVAAGVLAATAVLIVVIALLGQAMVHRSRAQTAADAIALASAGGADPDAAQAADHITDWYLARGVQVSQERIEHTVVISGPSQAIARAGIAEADTLRTPALVAIVARAEQLLGATITPTSWQDFSLVLSPDQGRAFATVAADLGLCEVVGGSAATGSRVFALC